MYNCKWFWRIYNNEISFEENGFINDCEYIIADNSMQNEFDAYQAISRFLKMATGEYILQSIKL